MAQPGLLLLLLATVLHSARCHPPKRACDFHSQSGEDRVLHQWFFNDMQNGTFVEIGAMDGILYSNSMRFEQCQQWAGRLIEGNPHNFQRLLGNLPQRPRSDAIHSAVCPPPMTEVNFTVAGDLVAGSQLSMAEAFVRKWHTKRGRPPQFVEVPCRPMSALLQDLRHIDYWSLDVEGAELVAIETVDWTAVRIDVITIELDGYAPAKNLRIRQILHGLGYSECRWGALRGNNALFVSNASRYTCGGLGTQPCLCSYHDCKTCTDKTDK